MERKPRASAGMVPARSPVAATLLLALLACTAEIAAGGGRTICDTANCGKGTCSEVPGAPIPLITTSYNCTCDPGWSQPTLFNLPPVPFAPCIIPDSCAAVNCGPGKCKNGEGWMSYTCECDPGYVNLLNLTALPCVKNCVFGLDCSRLGIAPPTPPPPADQSTAPPPGSVPSRRLLQLLLLLVSLAMVQLV
ncbi:hypothetical protein BAE44_0002709 [Dichanthelium oligosanthes]|uniref:EGF-like domain-containing protein n=1 Tax=Dichanthelium oligosanthes TaxID=888268 RepID=A0A1E5WFV3_9POAL|nr:hypothetical protein BAE44_0002709 [Dichanthelium oligosanthes]